MVVLEKMNFRICIVIASLVLFTTEWLTAQTTLSGGESNETVQVQPKKTKGYFKIAWRQPYPNPYRAGIYSLILPSAGQFYNRRYWKMPIVWGGFAALVVSVDYNKGFRDRFETAYGLSVVGLEHEFTGLIRDSETLRRYRNSHDKNLQLSYVGFFGLYALTALDAYVDAHLKNFDIDDNLSLSIRPVFNGVHQSGVGLGLVLSPKD